MRQLLQDLRNGNTQLVEVPAPFVRPGHILIISHYSLVSLGTERMLVEFGKANWFQKIRQQPERVKQVLNKVKTDGILPTWNAVQKKLDQQIPLGYCNVGEVVEVGAGVTDFKPGDKVVSNGPHAEVVCVSQNLAAKIPEGVNELDATFTVMAAIALQGIRLVAPSFGERIVVMGAGLIGQLTAQLLKANGCEVWALDTDENRLQEVAPWAHTASNLQSNVALIREATEDVGADAVIITANTQDNQLISDAAQMCRKRGKIILVGVAGMHINRSDFYEKELSFQVSCSYGPGRYDDQYEEQGVDYPIGFVRWTAKRNFESVLQAMAKGQIDVSAIKTKKHKLEQFEKVYSQMDKLEALAHIFVYEPKKNVAQKKQVLIKSSQFLMGRTTIGVIGTGAYVSGTLLPSLKKVGATVESIAGNDGLQAGMVSQKYGIPEATTDIISVLEQENMGTLFIANKHSRHAHLAAHALRKGKNVFVEKPLAIREEELEEVEQAYNTLHATLMVGYNRRFAPLAETVRRLLHTQLPINFIFTVNTGKLPPKHWLNQPEEGGRIVGEACHFIDLAAYWTHAFVDQIYATALNGEGMMSDNMIIHLQMSDGSQGSIHYFSNGSGEYDKERLEIYQNSKTLIIENWKKLSAYGFRQLKSKSGNQDKGHQEMYRLYHQWLQKGGAPLIEARSLFNTSKATLAALQSLNTGHPVQVAY